MSYERPLAQPYTPDCSNEWHEIEAFMDSAEAPSSPMHRAALRRLAQLPYECTTILELCRSVTAILGVLHSGPDEEAAQHAVDHALDESAQKATSTEARS